jgi:hypothetical protein
VPVDSELSFAGKKVLRAVVEVATDPDRLAQFAKPTVFASVARRCPERVLSIVQGLEPLSRQAQSLPQHFERPLCF